MRIFARNTRGRPSDPQGREPEIGDQRVARCPRARRASAHHRPLFLVAWISLILVALIACEPGIDTVDEYSETGSYGTVIDLPTMDEDAAQADAELLATRLDSLGSTVQEIVESVAEASTVDAPIAATATPEPFRLALAELEADAESGEISLQSERILDGLTTDLNINVPTDPDLVMASLVPNTEEVQQQHDPLSTATPVADEDDDEESDEEEAVGADDVHPTDTDPDSDEIDHATDPSQNVREPEDLADDEVVGDGDLPDTEIPIGPPTADDTHTPGLGSTGVDLSGMGQGIADVPLFAGRPIQTTAPATAASRTGMRRAATSRTRNQNLSRTTPRATATTRTGMRRATPNRATRRVTAATRTGTRRATPNRATRRVTTATRTGMRRATPSQTMVRVTAASRTGMRRATPSRATPRVAAATRTGMRRATPNRATPPGTAATRMRV